MSHFENLIEKICLLDNLEFAVYLWFIRMFQNTLAIPQSCFSKQCSAYILLIYGRTNVWENYFNKVALRFIETTLSHCSSPGNLQYIHRIPFLKSISGWLLASTPIAQAAQYLFCEDPVVLRRMLLLLSRELKVQ